LAASVFQKWPGNQNPRQGYLVPDYHIEVLLLGANDLSTGAKANRHCTLTPERSAPLSDADVALDP
jgi:hypothetical protein